MRIGLLGVALLAVGCRSGSCPAELLPEVRTVARVSSAAGYTGRTWIEYGVDSAYDLSTPVVERDGSAFSELLMGLPPLSTVRYRLRVDDGGEVTSCGGSIRTGNTPVGLPALALDVHDPAAVSSERFVLGSLMGDQQTLFAIDRSGAFVWYMPQPEGVLATDMQLAREAGRFVHSSSSADRGADESVVRRVGFDGAIVEEIRTELGHHAFSEQPDGSIAWLAIDVRDWTDPDSGISEPVVGDALMERSPDGAVRTIWSAWDTLQVVEHDLWSSDFYPQGRDWTHGNGLSYDPTRDSFLVSLGHIDTIVEVARADGAVLRVFGSGDYPPSADSRAFHFQHGAHYTSDGTLLMFSADETGSSSGAIEYAVDDESQQIVEVWSYGLDSDEYAPMLGGAERLANGNTLVNYGGAGMLREITAAGEVVWQIRTRLGTWFGNVHAHDSFYPGQ